MIKQERDYFPWIAGVLIFGAIIALNVIRAREVNETTTAPPVVAESPEPEAMTLNEPLRRFIDEGEAFDTYVCDTGGVRQYSDRPCAAGAVAVRIPITLSTVPAPPLPPAPVIATPSRETGFPPLPPRRPIKRDPACDRLFGEKDRIDARMRAGYGNRYGEHLRADHHRVTERIRDLHCYQ